MFSNITNVFYPLVVQTFFSKAYYTYLLFSFENFKADDFFGNVDVLKYS